MMDLHVLGKFIGVLLCAVGVVVAEDECATFGNVNGFYEECITDSLSANPYINKDNSDRARKCGFRAAIRQCMVNKTTNCAEHALVMAEVDNAFYVCDGTNVSSWVQQYMIRPEAGEFCQPNMTAANVACSANAGQASQGYPFTNRTLSDGLVAVKGMKRASFSCFQIALGASGDCTESARNRTYMHQLVTIMENVVVFGIYIEETDRVDIVQNENSLR